MDLAGMRAVLLYCTLINFAFLAAWGLLCLLPHRWMYRIAERRFQVPAGQLDAINLAGIVFYKVCVVMFNLVPYAALRMLS